MAITLVEPRTFLIVGNMRKFGDTTGQRRHVVAQLCPERMGVAPVHIGLTIVVGIDAGVDIKPVALVPYQRLAERIFERSIGRVSHQHTDAMTMQWSIEIVFAIALYRLDSPGTVFT